MPRLASPGTALVHKTDYTDLVLFVDQASFIPMPRIATYASIRSSEYRVVSAWHHLWYLVSVILGIEGES